MSADHQSGIRQNLLLPDLSIGLSILLSFALFKSHSDLVLLTSWVLIFGYVILMKRYDALMHQLLATTLAAIWVHFAKDYYSYHFDYMMVLDMNSLPLMAWTLILFGLGEYCSYCNFKKKMFDFLFFVFVVWTFGILFETVAYHLLGIRNTMTGNFVGLPICDCIHAPTWMKVAYALMAPVYYSLKLLADTGIRNLTRKNESDVLVPASDAVRN